jgi:agmatine deiminase
MKRVTRHVARWPAAVPTELGYRWPAEWERHEATWLAWPHAADWPGKAAAIPWVFAEMARQLGRRERVRILVRSAAERSHARSVLGRAGVPEGSVEFFRHATDRSWTRDFLPLFVVRRRRAGRGAELGAVKWRFNGWGRYANHHQDEAAGLAVADGIATACWRPATMVRGRERLAVLEGGAIDGDGQGTCLASRPCLVSGPRARNRALGQAGLERLLRDHLRVQRVLWMGDGIDGDDTSGHVDDFVRFVAPSRVVIAREPNRRDSNAACLDRARECLRGATDARGRRLELIELPMPEPVSFRGERLPASYANFYVANGVVLVPTFNDVADRVALGILSELFPGRRVVGIHSLDLVLGLGALHCSTQQQPAAG